MKVCLFWVKEDSTEKIIPVFDVRHEKSFISTNTFNGFKFVTYFLVFSNKDGFHYEDSKNYSAITTDWQECCQLGGE